MDPTFNRAAVKVLAFGLGDAHDATFFNIRSEYIDDMIVPLPPLAEQHRIVEKLEQLLGEIDKLKK